MSAPSKLERFALKAHQEGRLGGVGIAVHAIPDAFTILHGGVGCKFKHQGELPLHDLARPAHNICAYTEVTDKDLTGGSGKRIGPYLRSWQARRKPAFMVVATVTFLEMTGEDFGRELEDLATTTPCATAYLPCLGFEGDLYEGYRAVTLEVMKKIPWASGAPDAKTVTLLGYLYDRYEMDHEANLQQVKILLATLGLKMGPTLLSGRPFGELMGAAASGLLLGLPYLGDATEAAKVAGRPVVPVGLPVGIAGTVNWMADVAKAAGLPPALIERYDRAAGNDARAKLGVLRHMLQMSFGAPRSAVFADTALAAGLATLMVEAGLPPVLVGLSDRSLGGRAAFLAAAAKIGVELPPDLEILECPSLERVRVALAEHGGDGDLAAVLGSSIELNCLPEGLGRTALVELGYPSVTHHAIAPTPFYGLAGALGICQRILNQVANRSFSSPTQGA